MILEMFNCKSRHAVHLVQDNINASMCSAASNTVQKDTGAKSCLAVPSVVYKQIALQLCSKNVMVFADLLHKILQHPALHLI